MFNFAIKVRRCLRLFNILGLIATLKFVLCRKFGCSISIHPKSLLFPIKIRGGTSDIQVFCQIFDEMEYACLDDQENVGLIVDCGANVGCSSAWFLTKFPQSSVVAIEPDSGNFLSLQRNLAPYGDRTNAVRAGIWSHRAKLAVVQENYRDGREWSRQVRECEDGESEDILGIDINSILQESGHERISILKMDIEGAEAVVFSKSFDKWLHKVDAIAIELHDDSSFGDASKIFYSAIEGQNFHISKSGELTICRRSLD